MIYSYTKPDKDKKPYQCPHCGSMNTQWTKGIDNAWECNDCDSTWFEYEDSWWSAFQQGKIIRMTPFEEIKQGLKEAIEITKESK